MTPLEFLKEEFENAKRLLRESLRHDYGPVQSDDYYEECDLRLDGIAVDIPTITATDTKKIFTYLDQISHLNFFVSLIERSRLGEFSWPFAYELREIANILLTEKGLSGQTLLPIVHLVAEGQGYRIYYESQVPMATSNRRFVVVQFPRSLKHHVLLHALFGHELGHNALSAATTSAILQNKVLFGLLATGPLKDLAAMNAWVNSASAPQEVKAELAAYQQKHGAQFAFTAEHRKCWLIELICDYFGFLLFGPAFMAAHRAYLESHHPNGYAINVDLPTHPPFAVRHKMLGQLMDITGWKNPITSTTDGHFHGAETEFLHFLLQDNYDKWAEISDITTLPLGVNAVTKLFSVTDGLGYEPTNVDQLKALLTRLVKGLPPILADIEENGLPKLTKMRISQTLYAGWVYWTGRAHLSGRVELDFFQTNRLCDQALLQERAIKITLAAGVP